MQKVLKLWAHLHAKFVQFALSTFIHHPTKHKTKHKYTNLQQRPPFHKPFTLPIFATFLKQAFLAYLQLALNKKNDLSQFTLKHLYEVI